jgi:hypothetical protein
VADDHKRSELVCFKVTERMFLDLHRMVAIAERTPSDFMYGLLRKHLYGCMVPQESQFSQSTKVDEVDR